MTRDANGKTINIGSVVRVSTPWERPGDEPVTFTVGKIYPNGVAQHSNGMGYSYNSDWVEVIDTEDGAPMTLDLAKLKEAAEKALPHPFKGVDTTAEQMLAAEADAETILALIERLESAEGLLRDLEPHLDAIVCYASTIEEHEPNRIAVEVRAHLEVWK